MLRSDPRFGRLHKSASYGVTRLLEHRPPTSVLNVPWGSITGDLRRRMESADPRAQHSASCVLGLILDHRRIVLAREHPDCEAVHQRVARGNRRGPKVTCTRGGPKGSMHRTLAFSRGEAQLYLVQEAKPSALDPVNSSSCRGLGCGDILGLKGFPVLRLRRVRKSLA